MEINCDVLGDSVIMKTEVIRRHHAGNAGRQQMRYGLPQSVQKKSRHYLKEDENCACVCLSPQERTFEKAYLRIFPCTLFRGEEKSAARQARSVRQIACRFESLRGCSAFSRRDGYRSGYGCRLRRQNHRQTKDEKQAFDILKELSGKTHSVYTGVCVVRGGKKKAFVRKSRVLFFPLTDERINSYIATGSPMDKAGAYGIQGQRLCQKNPRQLFQCYGTACGKAAQNT